MDSSMILFLAWILALLLDLFYGEFPNALHPVVWMGQCIRLGEKIFLGLSPRLEFYGGLFLALVIPAGFGLLAWKSLQLLEHYPYWQLLVGVFWFKASFALKALGQAGVEVQRHMALGDIEGARWKLRSLCSRNAAELNEEELTEAAISSLAENLSDSVIAPWLFAAVFGIPGAVVYRAVNTMDAMIGYKNHYKNLGCCAARLDDVLNLLPARLTAFFLLAAGRLPSTGDSSMAFPSGREAWFVTLRDHANTPSPNGGWPMATMAGLLGITLRKKNVYTLGIKKRPSELHLMSKAWQLSERAAYLAWPCFLLLGIYLQRWLF